VTGSPVTVPLSGSNLWGFSIGAAAALGTCQPDSLAGWLRDEVNTVTTGSDLSANYEWPPGMPALRGTPSTVYSRPSGATITVEFRVGGVANLAFAKDFGFDSTSITFTAGGARRTKFNSAGYFSPYPNFVARDFQSVIDPVFITENSTGTVIEVVRWGSKKTDRTIEFPTVYAADVYLYRRENAGFATPAERDVADPNNLLENLFTAAGEGSPFRIYETDEDYNLANIVDQNMVRDMSKAVTDISGRGAMYEVAVKFRAL